VVLFVWCTSLISDHRHSWSSGQANGLIFYLICTTLLCICRGIAFSMVPFAGEDCDTRYKSWQWEVDGSGNATQIFDFTLILLSTASSGLFFTSYTYFAHSLAKVLDMLTIDHASNTSSTTTDRFLILLLGLNICVWMSILALWIFTLFELPYIADVDSVAQFSVAFAALTTCMSFSVHFLRAFCFLHRNRNGEGGRVAQLNRLLKLKRVLGVCRVCTICFAIRAVLLLSRATLGPMLEDAYFLFAEATPTAYMLYAFRSSSSDSTTQKITGTAMSEFEVLKASLTSNIALVSSPARAGFTSRYYASPEKDNRDPEERRLLHTPNSDITNRSDTSTDPLEESKDGEFFLL